MSRVTIIRYVSFIILIIIVVISVKTNNNSPCITNKSAALHIAEHASIERYHYVDLEKFHHKITYISQKNIWVVSYVPIDASSDSLGGVGPYVVINAGNGEIV
jgi:hypothetical protein